MTELEQAINEKNTYRNLLRKLHDILNEVTPVECDENCDSWDGKSPCSCRHQALNAMAEEVLPEARCALLSQGGTARARR